MSRRDQAVFVALAVLLVVLSILSNVTSRSDAADPRASSYLFSDGGTAALFLAMEALEMEQKTLTEAMASAGYHTRGGEQMRRDVARAQEIERELEAAFERWAALDARDAKSGSDPS